MAVKCEVISLKKAAKASIKLADAVFGVTARQDILRRVVDWQLAKRRAGTHKTKSIGEIRGTTAKPFRQKGTGRSRQGSRRSPQYRGGSVIFGPVLRSHAFGLPKKVRKLGLKMALSLKCAQGKLRVLDAAKLDSPKTKGLAQAFARLELTSALVIDGPEVDVNFARAAANLVGFDVIPQQGANVYDILRCDTLVLTREGVKQLEARLQ